MAADSSDPVEVLSRTGWCGWLMEMDCRKLTPRTFFRIVCWEGLAVCCVHAVVGCSNYWSCYFQFASIQTDLALNHWLFGNIIRIWILISSLFDCSCKQLSCYATLLEPSSVVSTFPYNHYCTPKKSHGFSIAWTNSLGCVSLFWDWESHEFWI